MPKVILAANTEWYLYRFRLSLAVFLRQQGFEVVFASPPGPYAESLEQAGFQWKPWKVGRQTLSPRGELGAISSLTDIYRRERADLVHHFTIKPVLYGSLAAYLAGVQGIVNSITGLGYVFLQDDLKARIVRQLVKTFYRFIFMSPKSAGIFENQANLDFFVRSKLVPASRCYLIEGVGVDADYFAPVPESQAVPIIVLPARMLWDKGVGVLVEAARLLHMKNEVRVALVGEPDPGNPATIPVEQLHSWVNEGVVEWWGWREDMRAVFRSCHIVTLPSMGEGIPTVLLEAAACARPIVTTNTPGCKDVVQHGINGLVVPPNDPEALAEALQRLILDPGLRGRMGAAGRQIVLEKYTNDRVNAANLAVYNKVLKRPQDRQIPVNS